MIIQKSKDELNRMRKAGIIASGAIVEVSKVIKPGVPTSEIDDAAEDFILSRGAKPAFKGYRGFPASACVSLNDVVVHGIPGKKRLKEGDIVSVDIGVELNGFFADVAFTYPVGIIDKGTEKLMECTMKSLEAGIDKCVANVYLYDISAAIEDVVKEYGFSIVKDYVGHGIGRSLHEDPQVPNYAQNIKGPRLKPGVTLAIEPMVNAGTHRVFVDEKDGWAVHTEDGSISVHFEHTVAITESGPWILTIPEGFNSLTDAMNN